MGWFSRLMGSNVAAPPARAARQATPAAPKVSAPGGETPAFGLRRPLVGRDGAVTGFELLLPEATVQRLAARDDPVAHAAHQAALMAAAAPLAAGGRAVLLRLGAATLARPGVQAAAVKGLCLQVDDLATLPADVARSLRQRGVLLGAPDGPPRREPAVDFVVLQASVGGSDTLLLSAQRWREAWPKLSVMALGLAHLDDVERVLRGGVNCAGGQLGRSATPAAARELGSAAHRICELLNHLALDRDTVIVGDAVRGDVALSYRLLRYANSPAIGLSRAVETVEQAVTVLGRAELYRWLSVQLMSAAAARQASKALQESALARGRLLELLARERGDADPGAHFTLGMLSLIEPLLQVPLAAALEPLRLGEASREALLSGRGPWADRLALLEAIDGSDAARFEMLAEGLGLGAELPVLVAQAWGWAADAAAAS
jgi:EAL and modified HD-GYP domain-containing signal transduction protein